MRNCNIYIYIIDGTGIIELGKEIVFKRLFY